MSAERNEVAGKEHGEKQQQLHARSSGSPVLIKSPENPILGRLIGTEYAFRSKFMSRLRNSFIGMH